MDKTVKYVNAQLTREIDRRLALEHQLETKEKELEREKSKNAFILFYVVLFSLLFLGFVIGVISNG